MTPESSPQHGVLDTLVEGQRIPYGGSRWVSVSGQLASEFQKGDQLVVIQETGDLLHIPGAVAEVAHKAVSNARTAFAEIAAVDSSRVTKFFETFAANLQDEHIFSKIKIANDRDVDDAIRKGRSTTRLILSEKMRIEMITALHMWRDLGDSPTTPETVQHDSWTVEARKAPLGIIGFVFEGRPNVFADATGVLRSGNTVVFRIGSDALNTARAIMESALVPALQQSQLPLGCVQLIDSPERSAGYALFSEPGLSLAVARGSGQAVAQLGAVARQSGIPVSLHGTGGAWAVIGQSADANDLAQLVCHSLDRKVCNTLNVCCVPLDRHDLLLAVLNGAALAAKGRRGKLVVHAIGAFTSQVLGEMYSSTHLFDLVEHDDDELLGTEWEWDEHPEFSVRLVSETDEAINLFNAHSPHFVLSVVSSDQFEIDRAYQTSESPFFGNGFTRWVDGQYALNRPELGLSNWQNGRLFARSGILSGDGVFTTRFVMKQSDPRQHR
jgi:glutamate-5-semialdehyde dehydrogenase